MGRSPKEPFLAFFWGGAGPPWPRASSSGAAAWWPLRPLLLPFLGTLLRPLVTCSPAHLGSRFSHTAPAGAETSVCEDEKHCFLLGERKRWSGSFVFGNRSGVECEGCYPDGACNTCAVRLDFLIDQGLLPTKPPKHFLRTVSTPGHLGGCTAPEFAHSQWTSEQVSDRKWGKLVELILSQCRTWKIRTLYPSISILCSF